MSDGIENDAAEWQRVRDRAREIAKEALGLPMSDDTKLHGLTFGAVVFIAAKAATDALEADRARR